MGGKIFSFQNKQMQAFPWTVWKPNTEGTDPMLTVSVKQKCNEFYACAEINAVSLKKKPHPHSLDKSGAVHKHQHPTVRPGLVLSLMQVQQQCCMSALC